MTPLMKRSICLFILMAFIATGKAQMVSLDQKEIIKMRKDIVHDKQYQDVFEPYKQRAFRALGETPNPIAEILSQGLLAGDPRKTASLKALEDADKIYALAFAYMVLGDKKFLDKADVFLLAWAKVYKATE